MERQTEETIVVTVPSLPRDELIPHKVKKDEYKLNFVIKIILFCSIICIGVVVYIGIENELK